MTDQVRFIKNIDQNNCMFCSSSIIVTTLNNRIKWCSNCRNNFYDKWRSLIDYIKDSVPTQTASKEIYADRIYIFITSLKCKAYFHGEKQLKKSPEKRGMNQMTKSRLRDRPCEIAICSACRFKRCFWYRIPERRLPDLILTGHGCLQTFGSAELD